MHASNSMRAAGIKSGSISQHPPHTRLIRQTVPPEAHAANTQAHTCCLAHSKLSLYTPTHNARTDAHLQQFKFFNVLGWQHIRAAGQGLANLCGVRQGT